MKNGISTVLLALGLFSLIFSCRKDKKETNNEPVSTALEYCASSTDTVVYMNPVIGDPLPDTFNISDALKNRTTAFYDSVYNWPVNQSTFGTCETSSSCGLLSYGQFHNTNTISPLYTLMNAHEHPILDSANKPQPFYLWGDPSLPKLWGFFRSYGSVKFAGVPAYSGNAFVELSTNLPLNSNNHPDYTQLPTIEPKPNPWMIDSISYERDLANHTVSLDTVAPFLVISSNVSVFQGTLHSDRIAYALDHGYLVLIMFRYLYEIDENTGKTCLFDRYNYDTISGQLTHDENAGLINYNTWKPHTSTYKIGETHWVYIFSYATSGSSKIFFIRNSWGNKRGENGNYYMTDTFLDGTYKSTKCGGTTCPILKYYYGFKIE